MWQNNSMRSTARHLPRQSLLGTPIDPVGRDTALELIGTWLAGSEGALHHVVTVNPEFVVEARRNARFREVLWAASLATVDGIGVVLAARALRVQAGERVTGVDLVEGLAEMRHPQGRLFLLGAAPGVAQEAAERLRERFPGVQIVGAFPGSPRDEDFGEIAARLEEARPSVLLVAFGHPRQDLWIARHREWLATHGILVAIGIGGTFDYLSGRVPRAPRLLRRLGLEWFYRLIRQPWRWRRQLALPLFVLLVLRERLRRLPLLRH
jgi:N-acetylglucosaminyldiphosphoundecaprenol N-acetyl-beta-D-mannosaminyltransferase